MKNIGNPIKQYGAKPIVNLLYLIPVVLLLAGIVGIAIAMFKAPTTERNYYYIGMVILLVLIVILLIGRSSALPQYSFELCEKGIRIVYKKEKIADEEFGFDEITEIWQFATNGSSGANHLAFLPIGADYKIISPKFSNYKGLMRKFVEIYLKSIEPIRSAALTKGDRLVFPMLPTDGENIVQSEKAIIPYLKQTQKEHLSLDRFSVFDGQKTYALADIQTAEINSENNIIVNSVAGTMLYRKSYFAVCNADLFVRLVNEVAFHKTENPEKMD
ncbi:MULTISPECIES: hypothetical protein [Chitinophagaceae]